MSFVSCCVPGCTITTEDGVLHKFPNPSIERERFKKWVQTVGDTVKEFDEIFIYNNRRVCRRHFAPVFHYPKNRLSKLAIPTLFIEDMRQVLHKFPNPEKDRERFNTWLYAIRGDILGLENEYIYKYRRVCRSHFEHKYLCRNNKISSIAVPTLNMPDNQSVSRENQGLQEAAPSTVDEVLDTSVTAEVQESLDKSPSPVEEEADAPVEVKEVCRICLAFHVKMYNIQEHNLCQMLYDIAGIKVGENDGIFQYVCYECAARLSAASAFTHKALKSDGMLQRLMNCGDTIAEQITFLKENLEILKPTLTVQEVFITTDIAEEPNIKLNLIDDKAVETTHAVIKEKYKDIVKTFCDVETIDNFVPTERSLTMKNIKEHESTTLNREEDNSNAITKEELTRRVRERLQELKCCNVPDLVKEFGVTTELVQKIIDDTGLKKGYKRKKTPLRINEEQGKRVKSLEYNGRTISEM